MISLLFISIDLTLLLIIFISMKRLILFVIIGAMSIAINDVTAQTVSYTYKALAAEGCSMKYSVAKQNENLLSAGKIQIKYFEKQSKKYDLKFNYKTNTITASGESIHSYFTDIVNYFYQTLKKFSTT